MHQTGNAFKTTRNMSIKSLVAENNLGATPKAPRHANRPRFRYSLGRGAQLPGVFPGLGATTPEGELHQAPLQTQHQIRGAIQLEDYVFDTLPRVRKVIMSPLT